MKITFNNFHNNRDKNSQQSKEITIDRSCVITNYDPNPTKNDADAAKNPSGAGRLTLSVEENQDGNGKVEYKRGNSIFNGEDVKLNQTKYSVFTAIATADKNDAEGNALTLDDLNALEKICDKKGNLKKNVNDKHLKGIWQSLKNIEKGLRIDFDKIKEGKVVIHIGDDELLCIDFETDKERASNQPAKAQPASDKSSPKTEPSKAPSTKSNDAAKTNETSVSETKNNSAPKTDNKTSAKGMKEYVKNCISGFKGGKIDINDVKDLDTVAEYTGLSKEYIKNVLVDMEGHQGWPATTAYYDGVADAKHPKGNLTIGFGHTSHAGGLIVEEGMEITKEQAFQILANDIVSMEKICKNKLGNLYKEAPKSIQDAIVDMVFNKGPSAINESLKANLEKKYYHSATRRTWYETDITGLQKRNMYRFLAAIRDLNASDKENAVKNFRSEHLNHLINAFNSDINAKKDWNEMCKKYKLEKYSIN